MIDFLAANWPWILIGGALVWMHTGRGGCGAHGGHGDYAHRDATTATSQDAQHGGGVDVTREIGWPDISPIRYRRGSWSFRPDSDDAGGADVFRAR